MSKALGSVWKRALPRSDLGSKSSPWLQDGDRCSRGYRGLGEPLVMTTGVRDLGKEVERESGQKQMDPKGI